MTVERPADASLSALDPATRALVRLSAAVTAGGEDDVRRALEEARGVTPVATPDEWIEELILQSYLFAGFPRALNAMREWRRVSGREAPANDEGTRPEETAAEWRMRGEATCAAVYGRMYESLRLNIRALHPALDSWMVVEGYGKVLSRAALDLTRRELCIVAACAAARQDRQLHSHLHGALNSGASPAEVEATLAAIDDLLADEDSARYRRLWEKVRGS